MNDVRKRKRYGVALCALAALIIVGVAEAFPAGVTAPLLAHSRPATGVEVVIVCDWGNGLVGPAYTPWERRAPAIASAHPGLPLLPQSSRSPFAPIPTPLGISRATAFTGARPGLPIFKPPMARGCRPVVVVHGVPG